MNDEIFKNLIAAIQPVAEACGQIDTKAAFSNLYQAMEQYCELLKVVNPSEEFLNSMAVLVKEYGKLSELQLIALSKEVKPSEIELTKEQNKIRSQITQKEAEKLKYSVDLDTDDGKYFYKNDKISKEKVKTAVEIAGLFDDITVDDILSFSEVLYTCPYLALRHEIGENIFNSCKVIPEKYITCVKTEIPLFRARKMEDEDTLYSDSEMDQAPFKVPGQGRFNTEGVARFYVSGLKEDAIEEIVKHSKAKDTIYIQVAEYRASKELRLIDFGKINNKLSEKCTKNVSKPDKFNSEYLISGFIAQCLDYHKSVDGIKYGMPGHDLYAFFKDNNFIHVDKTFVKKNYEE